MNNLRRTGATLFREIVDLLSECVDVVISSRWVEVIGLCILSVIIGLCIGMWLG